MVSPQINTSDFVHTFLNGTVRTGFANVTYIGGLCQTPVRADAKGESTRKSTCLEVELAGGAYKNYGTWLGRWENYRNTGEGSSKLSRRPPGFALLNDDTTVTGQWVEQQDMEDVSAIYGRWVNNVSLAMPHAGVVTAAKDPVNKMLQPQTKNNFGSYDLHASVTSPVINVLCVNMSAEEKKPMVYAEWPNAASGLNWTNWTAMTQDPSVIPPWRTDEWLNSTVVDDIFQLGPNYGQIRPPVFPHLPNEYNTILNNTAGSYASRNALWLLGSAPANVGGYALCSLRVHQTMTCSTWYNATSSGSTLSAQCELPHDDLQYIHAATNATNGNETISFDWVDLADGWGNSVSLNAGITDGDASNARLLTQLIPTSNFLNPEMPSIAEALAVMASGTLLASNQDAPFKQKLIDTPPFSDRFPASLRSVQYASGAMSAYQDAFYIILFIVFLGNVLVLTWLVLNRGLVTDYADPSNLFALTINSPPSHAFAGSCGGGPDAKQYKARWYLNIDGDHVYLQNDERLNELAEKHSREGKSNVIALTPSPVMQTYSKLSSRKSIL